VVSSIDTVTPVAAWSAANADGTRELGGYRFVPAPDLDGPFLVTDFSSATGAAIAKGVDVPLLVVPGDPPDTLLTLEGDFVYVLAIARYQQRVSDRLAVRFRGSGTSRVGTSGEALLSQGLSATYGGGVGATVALGGNDRLLCSGLLDFKIAKVLVIDFVRFAQDVVDGQWNDLSLIKTEWRKILSGGLSTAYALNHWSGVVAMGNLGGAIGNTGGASLAWRLAVALSMDLARRRPDGPPIGIVLTGALDDERFVNETQADLSSKLGLGVFYTGRPDLALGLDVDWSRVRFAQNDSVAYPFSFSLALRYLFF